MKTTMKLRLGLATVLAALTLAGASVQAAEPYDLHVILPLTGGGAFGGKGDKDTLNYLAEMVNDRGGLNGQPLRFVFHDDQTSPQVAVQIANDVLADKPAVILGSNLVAMCAAIAPLMRNGPVDYCLSPSSPGKGDFLFSAGSSPFDQVGANIRYYRMKGWTRIAAISNTDASGQSFDRSLDQVTSRPENADMKLIAREHFNPSDISLAAQIERIKSSGAQAILVGATGSPVANVLKSVIQAGLDAPISILSGNEIFEQMQQWKSFLPKQMVILSSVFPEHEGVWTLDPRVETAQKEMYAVLAKHGKKADNLVATSWDAGLIMVDALKAIGPGATAVQVRDHIANLTGFAGVDGMYDFKAHPGRGLGTDSAILVRYDPQKVAWIWFTEPGGAPLK